MQHLNENYLQSPKGLLVQQHIFPDSWFSPCYWNPSYNFYMACCLAVLVIHRNTVVLVCVEYSFPDSTIQTHLKEAQPRTEPLSLITLLQPISEPPLCIFRALSVLWTQPPIMLFQVINSSHCSTQSCIQFDLKQQCLWHTHIKYTILYFNTFLLDCLLIACINSMSACLSYSRIL